MPQNWNAVWESNFQPIVIGDTVGVRADFHPANPHLKYDMVITPKMSFGTGHHDTTALMLEHLMKMPLEGKTVLDMGCGTGVLGIFASLSGAKEVLAIDIDPWSYENTLENIQKNNSSNIKVQLGDASLLPATATFEVVIANINRSVLLQDMPAYLACLKVGGSLLLSGFYKADVEEIDDTVTTRNMILTFSQSADDWMLLVYYKK